MLIGPTDTSSKYIAPNTSDQKINLFLAVVAGGIGNIVEWYTFLSYAYLVVVISALFFPLSTQTQGIISSFLIFASGFLARPIGALIFGYLGDKIGRQKTLVWSQVMMAIPSLFICLIPTRAQIGIMAIVLLTTCRFLQGLCIAGEYTTSLCYLAEVSPHKKRGLYVSIIPASTTLGILLSSLVVSICISFMSKEMLYTWGWRAIFFIGCILCLLSAWIRRHLPETNAFLRVTKKRVGQPQKAIFRSLLTFITLKKMLIAAFLAIMYTYLYQLLYIWSPTFFVTTLKLKYSHSLILNSIAMLIFMCSIILGGQLSDILTRKITIIITSVIIIFSFGALFNHTVFKPSLINVAIFLLFLSIIFGIWIAACSVFFSETFDTSVRATALSISYNIPGIVGGFTSAFLELLVKKALFIGITYISTGIILLALISSLFIKDKTKQVI
jgi:MHS family proline/betaine transporter-like MFS transporter